MHHVHTSVSSIAARAPHLPLPQTNKQKSKKYRVFYPRHRPQSPIPSSLPPTPHTHRRVRPPTPSLPGRSAPMGYVLSAVSRVLEQPTAWGAAWEMALLAGPLWAAALLGLLLGWAWRPRWAAGLVVATADGSSAAAAAQAPAQPPFATLDFWKAQLPARLRAPLGYAGAAVQQREDDEDAVQGYVTVYADRLSGEMRWMVLGAGLWSKA